ncbi:MAG: DUF4252 domain-containing protein [Saprospiraceae bacterium]|nr:DUF4252 domain-containing protein [Saprospiraceae bacterium]
MKWIKLTLALLLMGAVSGLSAQANAIDKYFKQYVEDEHFSVVYVGPTLFKWMKKLGQEDKDDSRDSETDAVIKAVEDAQGLRILTTDINPRQYYDEAKSKINTKEYELLMTVRSKDGDNVEFLGKLKGDAIEELLLISVGEESFVLLSLVGLLDLADISKIADEIEE